MSGSAMYFLGPARLARGYAERLLAGVTPAMAARKPRNAEGGMIDTNHPVFVLGHLSLYPGRLLTLIGADASAAKTPDAWEALFKAGAPCHDDPTGAIYPALAEVSERFYSGTDAALAVLEGVRDDVLARVNPHEAMRSRFPRVGDAVNFMASGHVMMHLGQVSAWRRCMGLGSAM